MIWPLRFFDAQHGYLPGLLFARLLVRVRWMAVTSCHCMRTRKRHCMRDKAGHAMAVPWQSIMAAAAALQLHI